MTQVVPVGMARVIHSLTWAGDPEPMAVTYGIVPLVGSPLTPPDLPNFCATAFIDNILLETSSLISLTQTEVLYQTTAQPDPPNVYVDTTSGAGGDSGTVLPQNSSYLAHKRTAVGGKGGRGRLYIPGVIESACDNLGNISGAKITAWNTKLADFLSDLNALGDGVTMVIFHDSGGATAGDPPAEVTAMTIDPVLATQRKRLRR